MFWHWLQHGFVSLPQFARSHYTKLKNGCNTHIMAQSVSQETVSVAIGFNFMTTHFVSTEGDTEQQNIYVYISSQNFVGPLSFCKETITVNKTNQSAYTRHLQWGKTYFNNYFGANNPFWHRLGWKVIVHFSCATHEDTCRDTNPNSKFKQNKQHY